LLGDAAFLRFVMQTVGYIVREKHTRANRVI
jgi:hypothetical protein